jgi:hypothetical protein
MRGQQKKKKKKKKKKKCWERHSGVPQSSDTWCSKDGIYKCMSRTRKKKKKKKKKRKGTTDLVPRRHEQVVGRRCKHDRGHPILWRRVNFPTRSACHFELLIFNREWVLGILLIVEGYEPHILSLF